MSLTADELTFYLSKIYADIIKDIDKDKYFKGVTEI